jgi:hypothetical protein
MSQTNYPLVQPTASEGLLADLTPKQVQSFAAETALSPGRVVVRGTDVQKQCQLPAAATDITDANKILGISLREHVRENTTANPQGFVATDTVGVIMDGKVYMKVEDAVTAGEPVFARFQVNGGLDQLGKVRSDADGANAAQIPGARFETSADADGFAVVSLNKPGV